MTAIVDTGTETRPLLITSKTELSARSGGLLRALNAGAVIRVDDHNIMCEVALMIPPQLIPAVLRFIGIDPDLLPEPGTVRDAPDPDPGGAV
jgi:hypothetical protein